MAFNPEVALFNLLEDAQTAEELLSVIDYFLADEDVKLKTTGGHIVSPILYSRMAITNEIISNKN